MLRDALYLASIDARYLLSRRETVIWTFIMPVVFFYFIGTIMGNNVHSDTSADPIEVTTAADAGYLAEQLIARLEAVNFQVVSRDPTRRLDIPSGFTTSVQAGQLVRLRFTRTGQEADAEYDRVRISRAVYRLVADLALAGPNATVEQVKAAGAIPNNLTVEVRSAGTQLLPPLGFQQSVPGTMVMFTLLVLFTSGAVTLTLERERGILRRLASAPMTRGAVVLGKWGARMIVGGIQIGFAMLTGALLFHIHWGANLPMLLLVLLAYGALAAALAMLLGNAGRTEGQVIGLGVILSNLMAGLGGCWWPIEVTPVWAQKLALFMPTGLTMNALHKLVNFGAPAASVVPHLGVLILAASVALFVLTRTFRFQ